MILNVNQKGTVEESFLIQLPFSSNRVTLNVNKLQPRTKEEL